MRLERLDPRALVAASLLAGLAFQLLLGTSYVAAFLDPVETSTGLPVAVVNEDAGRLGEAFVASLAASDTPVAWVAVASVAEAERGLAEKRYYGALRIPANFSQALGSYASTAPRAALVETWSNPGASTAGNLVAARVLELVLESLEREAQARALAESTTPLGVGVVSVEQARFVADPVKVEQHVANPVPPGAANGLAPTYLAMGAWIGGYFGAVALERFRPETKLRASRRVLLVAAASAAQAAVAVVALRAVGFAAPDALLLAGVLALGTWMAYALVGLFLDLLGLPGVVPAFAIMALGIPASGAIYPESMLPAFYRALHAVDPFTWLVEALRTALHTGRAGDLAGHAVRLATLAAGASAASLAWAAFRGRAAKEP